MFYSNTDDKKNIQSKGNNCFDIYCSYDSSQQRYINSMYQADYSYNNKLNYNNNNNQSPFFLMNSLNSFGDIEEKSISSKSHYNNIKNQNNKLISATQKKNKKMQNFQNVFIPKLPQEITDNDLMIIVTAILKAKNVFASFNTSPTATPLVNKEFSPRSTMVSLDPSTGFSKGFGFVLFASSEIGKIAMMALNDTYITYNKEKKTVKINDKNKDIGKRNIFFIDQNKNRILIFRIVALPSKHDGTLACAENPTLYIRNIPLTTSFKELKELLIPYGNVLYAAARPDRLRQPVWVIFVEYDSVESARRALNGLHNNRKMFPSLQAPIMAKFGEAKLVDADDNSQCFDEGKFNEEKDIRLDFTANNISANDIDDSNANMGLSVEKNNTTLAFISSFSTPSSESLATASSNASTSPVSTNPVLSASLNANSTSTSLISLLPCSNIKNVRRNDFDGYCENYDKSNEENLTDEVVSLSNPSHSYPIVPISIFPSNSTIKGDNFNNNRINNNSLFINKNFKKTHSRSYSNNPYTLSNPTNNPSIIDTSFFSMSSSPSFPLTSSSSRCSTSENVDEINNITKVINYNNLSEINGNVEILCNNDESIAPGNNKCCRNNFQQHFRVVRPTWAPGIEWVEFIPSFPLI